MDELRELFGADGTEAVDFNTFTEKLSKLETVKLANLANGKYVDKSKYDSVEARAKELDKIAKEFETIKTERDTLKNEKMISELTTKCNQAGIGTAFSKFVISEVNALVTDKKNFDVCLAEYLVANPQFKGEDKSKAVDPKKVFTKGSSVKLEGGSGNEKSTNEKMNDIFRKKQNN